MHLHESVFEFGTSYDSLSIKFNGIICIKYIYFIYKVHINPLNV